jgi:predicted anti-sigma-YlaC factor YlaD
MLRLVPPSDCTEAREAVSARLDGERTELEAVRLEGHLRACADCCDFAAEAGSTALLLRDAPLEQPAVRIWAEPARPRRRLGVAGGMAAAAAVIVAAAAPSFLLGRTLGHQPATRTATGSSASEPSRSPVDPALLALLRGQQNQGGRIIHV